MREKLEQQTAQCFAELMKRFQPTLFLDVGANVGFYSWEANNLCPTIKTWMFEPDRSNVELLRRTVVKNSLSGVRIFAVAVAEQTGSIEFVVDAVSGKAGSVVDNRKNDGSLHQSYALAKTEKVDCINLDSLVAEMRGERVLVKMDIEGAEEHALRGSRTVLREVRPIIVLECFDIGRLSWLEGMNYEIIDLREKGNYLIVPREAAGMVAAFTR